MIFISHASADNVWCRKFAASLQRAGHTLWYDESVLAGDIRLLQTHQHELQQCDPLIVVLTPDAWRTPLVQDDVQLALVEQRPIVSLILKPTEASGFLLIRPWLDITERSADRAANMLLSRLPGLLADEVTTPVPIGSDQRDAACRVYLSVPILTARNLLRNEQRSRFERFHAMQALLFQCLIVVPMLAALFLGGVFTVIYFTPLRDMVAQTVYADVGGVALIFVYLVFFFATWAWLPLLFTRSFILSGKPVRMPTWYNVVMGVMSLGVGLLWIPLIAMCGGKNGRMFILAPIADMVLNRREGRERWRSRSVPTESK